MLQFAPMEWRAERSLAKLEATDSSLAERQETSVSGGLWLPIITATMLSASPGRPIPHQDYVQVSPHTAGCDDDYGFIR